MDVSLGSLRRRLLAMRAWDSQGKSLDEKLNSAINQALDRLAGDVPEALMPDDEHVVLQRPYRSGDESVKAYVRVNPTDKRLLEFVDKDGTPIDASTSATTWRPNTKGEWDGIMHIEVKDPRGRWHRRQCREFFDYNPALQPKYDINIGLQTGDAVVGVDSPDSSASIDSINDEQKADSIRIDGIVSMYDPSLVASDGTLSASNISAGVDAYLRRFGTKSARGFTGRSPQETQDKLRVARANGLDILSVTEEVTSEVKRQLKDRGVRFKSIRKTGGRVFVPKATQTNIASSYDDSLQRTVTDVSTDLADYDWDVSELDFESITPMSKPTVGGEAEEDTIRLDDAVVDSISETVPSLFTYKPYLVTLDRPWVNNVDGWDTIVTVKDGKLLPGPKSVVTHFPSDDVMEFRIYQPEFFVRDDVTEIHEPGVIYDETEKQVWAIDTAGADRAGMRDFQGDSEGRPSRLFRGRHFQLPAPTNAPKAVYSHLFKWTSDSSINVESLKRGTFKICYTYVWGRKDKEWQQSPSIAPTGHNGLNSRLRLNWAHAADPLSLRATSGQSGNAGISDPMWESAPSPVTQVFVPDDAGKNEAILIQATNVDAMMGFANPFTARYGRTGLRLRFYVAYTAYDQEATGSMETVGTSERFYLLCEAEPTLDQIANNPQSACRFFWTGAQLFDIERPLRHSTGYYAYKTYPTHDERYEIDFRVSRLPTELVDDRDTPPIQRDAVPALIELSAYYVALLDGADQSGAQVHLDRYIELARKYRSRYANPAKIVEPTSIVGGTPYRSHFNMFGTFKS